MFRKMIPTILAIGLLLSACNFTPLAAPEPTSTEPVLPATETATIPTLTLTDGLDRIVTLSGPPQRIISLTPATTEILFAIGAVDQIVGRDAFSDHPAEALALPDVGGSYGEYSQEAIVALQPDLVIAGGINPPELVASLESLGLTVFFLANPTSIDDMYTALSTLATLTYNEGNDITLIESLQARVAAVDEKIATISDYPTVYYELDATDPTLPYTAGRAGPTNFVTPLIERAGGVNIGSGLESEWASISLEQLIVADPYIIILGDSIYGETPEKVAARTGWSVLSAVQSGRIYPFNDSLVTRPGPRLVDGLEALARLLHPELFE